MKVHGTQRDVLPGEPNLAPLHAVLAEAYIGNYYLIRIICIFYIG